MRSVAFLHDQNSAGALFSFPSVYTCWRVIPTVNDRATDAAGEFVTNLFIESREELVRYLAFRVRDPILIDDLEQEVYIRLLRLDKVHLIRNPRAYVLRVAANVVVDHGRRLGSRIRQAPPDDGHTIEDGAGPFERLLWRERFERVQVAISSLPDRCQRALILHRRHGLTYDEIAAQLGVSRSMVKKYLKKALLVCRRAVGDEADDKGLVENWP